MNPDNRNQPPRKYYPHTPEELADAERNRLAIDPGREANPAPGEPGTLIETLLGIYLGATDSRSKGGTHDNAR